MKAEDFKRVQQLSSGILERLKALNEYDFLTDKEKVTVADVFIAAWRRTI